MPRDPAKYANLPGPFWYEDRIPGEGESCAACGRPAVILWVYRGPDDPNMASPVLVRPICRGCVFTPAGCIAVQQQLAPLS